MKPSELITAFMHKKGHFHVIFYSDVESAIIDYLDEEAEKPKYACPNCYRVVDELITVTLAEVACNTVEAMRLQQLGIQIPARFVDKKYCKHCDPRTRMEDKKC